MAQHTNIDIQELRGAPGHRFRIEMGHRREPARIVEEWVLPHEITERDHKALSAALREAMERLLVPLRQREAEARREARPERIALASAMGRPVDWNRNRRAVTNASEALRGVQSVLHMLPRFQAGMQEEHVRYEVSRCRAPIEIDLLTPRVSVPGTTMEAGSDLFLLQEEEHGWHLGTFQVREVCFRSHGRAGMLIHLCEEVETSREVQVTSREIGAAMAGESATLFIDRHEAERVLEEKTMHTRPTGPN